MGTVWNVMAFATHMQIMLKRTLCTQFMSRDVTLIALDCDHSNWFQYTPHSLRVNRNGVMSRNPKAMDCNKLCNYLRAPKFTITYNNRGRNHYI